MWQVLLAQYGSDSDELFFVVSEVHECADDQLVRVHYADGDEEDSKPLSSMRLVHLNSQELAAAEADGIAPADVLCQSRFQIPSRDSLHPWLPGI